MSMMKFCRDNIKFIFIFVIGCLIVSLFAGMGSYIFFEKKNQVMSINGEKIKIETFEQAKNNLINQIKEQNPTEEINENIINQKILDLLMQNTIFLQEAKKIGEKVGNKEIINFVMKYPVFQKNGQFDINTYYQVIKFNKQSPDVFEKNLAENIYVEKMKALLFYSIKTSQKEIDLEYENYLMSMNLQDDLDFEKKDAFAKEFINNKKMSVLNDWYIMILNKSDIKKFELSQK